MAAPCKVPGCGQPKAVSPTTGHNNGSYCVFHASEYHRLRKDRERAIGKRIHYGYLEFMIDLSAKETIVMEDSALISDKATQVLLDIHDGAALRDTPANPLRRELNTLLSHALVQVRSSGSFETTQKGRDWLAARGYAVGRQTYEDAPKALPAASKTDTDELKPVVVTLKSTAEKSGPANDAPERERVPETVVVSEEIVGPVIQDVDGETLRLSVSLPGLKLRASIEIERLKWWDDDTIIRLFRVMADAAIAARKACE